MGIFNTKEATVTSNGEAKPEAEYTRELYIRFRPTKFDQFVGQQAAVKQLKEWLRNKHFPHVTGFFGASGCGKTTAARICARYLGCKGRDFQEINAAASRGIETVRDIQSRVSVLPAFGACRVWLLDEVHKLTNDAQTALLKTLEDTPNHVYFMLASTDPQKLITPIRSRCTEVKFASLTPVEMQAIIENVKMEAKLAGISKAVLDALVENADGNGRKALVLLNQISGLKDEATQLKALEKDQTERDAFDLVQLLIWKKPSWKEARKLIEEINMRNVDIEKFRHSVLTCATKELLKEGGNHARAAAVMDAFRFPFYENPKGGVALACYNVLGQK